MHRRHVLGLILTAFVPSIAFGEKRKLHKYRIKYRPKPKGSITYTTIQAHNEEEAKAKLRKKFPECVILSVDEIK